MWYLVFRVISSHGIPPLIKQKRKETKSCALIEQTETREAVSICTNDNIGTLLTFPVLNILVCVLWHVILVYIDLLFTERKKKSKNVDLKKMQKRKKKNYDMIVLKPFSYGKVASSFTHNALVRTEKNYGCIILMGKYHKTCFQFTFHNHKEWCYADSEMNLLGIKY